MADNPEATDERPCLHCLIADLIDEFYAEYGSPSGEKDTVDMDEIISALRNPAPTRALRNWCQ